MNIWDVINQFEQKNPRLNVNERGLIHDLKEFMDEYGLTIVKGTEFRDIKAWYKNYYDTHSVIGHNFDEMKFKTVTCINPTETLTKGMTYLVRSTFCHSAYYPYQEYDIYELINDKGQFIQASPKRFK